MRTVRKWQTVKDWPPGHHNPRHNIAVTDGRGFHILEGQHGTRDDVDVFRNGDDYYVLSRNRSFPYVGLAYYEAPPAHPKLTAASMDATLRIHKLEPAAPTHEVFAQGDERVADYLGHARDLDRLTAMTVVKRLMEWFS